MLVIADFGACGEAMSCVRVHRLKAVIARNDASGMCKSANDATTVRIALLKVYNAGVRPVNGTSRYFVNYSIRGVRNELCK